MNVRISRLLNLFLLLMKVHANSAVTQLTVLYLAGCCSSWLLLPVILIPTLPAVTSRKVYPFILKESDGLSDAFNPGIHLQSTLTTRLLLPRRQSFVGRTPEASQTRGSWRTTPTRRRPPSAQPPCCFPHGDRQGRTCNPHFGLKTSGDIFSRLKKESKPKIQAALREVRRGGSNATTP